MTKIALIEVGAMHDECLYSQIQFLKYKNHKITLFCHADLEPRIKDFPDLSKIIYLDLSSKISSLIKKNPFVVEKNTHIKTVE